MIEWYQLGVLFKCMYWIVARLCTTLKYNGSELACINSCTHDVMDVRQLVL